MKSQCNNEFYYSSYWGTWSRVLLKRGGEYQYQIELNLTPVNYPSDYACKEAIIRAPWIRKHLTATKESEYTHELPDNVYNAIVSIYGQVKADYLLHHDFLNEIDFNKLLTAYSNGGCSFYCVKLDILSNVPALERIKTEPRLYKPISK